MRFFISLILFRRELLRKKKGNVYAVFPFRCHAPTVALDTPRDISHELPRKHINVSQVFLRLPTLKPIPAYAFLKHSCGSNGLAKTSTTLSRVETDLVTTNNLAGLLNNLVALSQDELDVARVRHVGVNLL
jgi:hypothetical protein